VNELSTEVQAKETHEKAVGYFKVSEQYGYKFIMEVKKIRDDRYYKDLGFTTFEEYCNSAWGFSKRWVNAKIQSASNLTEEDFGNFNSQFGSTKTFLLATMGDEQREQAINKGVPTEQGNKPIDKATQKEINEYRRKYKELEQQIEQAKKSEQIMQKQLEESETKEPETVEVIKEVVPANLKKEFEDTNRDLKFARKEIERLTKNQEYVELEKNDFDEGKADKQKKKLYWESEKNVLEMKVHVDTFLKNTAVTAFRKGAIASADNATKRKLKDSVEDLKEFTKQMEIVLSGRIEIK